MSLLEISPPLVYAAGSSIKRLALLHRSIRLKYVAMEGCCHDGAAGRLVYLGEGESLGYLEKVAFQKVTGRSISPVPLWALRPNLHQLQSSGEFVVVEISRLLSPLLPAGGFTSFPWARQKVFLRENPSGQRRSGSQKEWAKLVRKYGYRSKNAGVKAVTRFYQDLYEPYLKARFADLARPRSAQELRTAVGSGFVLKVYEDESWVAGAVCHLRENVLTVLALGCAPDYDYYLRRGALSAAYHYIFQWARDNGMAIVDLLRSRPHARDGVFNYKKMWGARLEPDIWVATLLRCYVPPNGFVPQGLQGLLTLAGGKWIELDQAAHGALEKSPGKEG
jgi:hypothetical protein